MAKHMLETKGTETQPLVSSILDSKQSQFHKTHISHPDNPYDDCVDYREGVNTQK